MSFSPIGAGRISRSRARVRGNHDLGVPIAQLDLPNVPASSVNFFGYQRRPLLAPSGLARLALDLYLGQQLWLVRPCPNRWGRLRVNRRGAEPRSDTQSGYARTVARSELRKPWANGGRALPRHYSPSIVTKRQESARAQKLFSALWAVNRARLPPPFPTATKRVDKMGTLELVLSY